MEVAILENTSEVFRACIRGDADTMNAPLLKREWFDYILARRMVIDLSGVTETSNTFWGIVASWHERRKQQQLPPIEIVNPSQTVRNALSLTRLATVVVIKEDLDIKEMCKIAAYKFLEDPTSQKGRKASKGPFRRDAIKWGDVTGDLTVSVDTSKKRVVTVSVTGPLTERTISQLEMLPEDERYQGWEDLARLCQQVTIDLSQVSGVDEAGVVGMYLIIQRSIRHSKIDPTCAQIVLTNLSSVMKEAMQWSSLKWE